jgi:hypothetical protein
MRNEYLREAPPDLTLREGGNIKKGVGVIIAEE